MTAPAHRRLPIFPLATVLFPDGILPLRIFEARYMDMVRDCLRDETEFGVCLITQGNEVGQPAEFERIGCGATIEHWDMTQLGLLNIRTRGTQRFDVVSSTVTGSGLILAEVVPLPPEPDAPVPDDYSGCAQLLKRILDDIESDDQAAAAYLPARPRRYDSATWVSYRLCELLPLTGPAKAHLLALNDPLARLRILDETLRQRKLI